MLYNKNAMTERSFMEKTSKYSFQGMRIFTTALISIHAMHYRAHSFKKDLYLKYLLFLFFFCILSEVHYRKRTAAGDYIQYYLMGWGYSFTTTNWRQTWSNETRKRITKWNYWLNISKHVNQCIASCERYLHFKPMSLWKAQSKHPPPHSQHDMESDW